MRKRIGVFDSGVGGITILKELRKAYPSCDYVYLGDTAHLPYGSKSPAQICKLSKKSAQYLKKYQLDLLIVACHTASSWALQEVQSVMTVPVIGMIEPGVSSVLEAVAQWGEKGQPLPILILATRSTIKSRAYPMAIESALIQGYSSKKWQLFEQACPLLVPLIEEGWADHPVLSQVLDCYLGSYAHFLEGVVLLGCTHYPWIRSAIQLVLPRWTILDAGQGVVRSVAKYLGVPQKADEGSVKWVFTDVEVIPEFAKSYMKLCAKPVGRL